MRKLSKHNDYQYWQCIIPASLANTINQIPSGESLLCHAKLIAEGFTFDLEDTAKQFRFARYVEGTMNYLALTQTEENFQSMQDYYFPIMYSLVKRVEGLGVLSYATMFQEFIRFASDVKPAQGDDVVAVVDTFVKRIIGKV